MDELCEIAASVSDEQASSYVLALLGPLCNWDWNLADLYALRLWNELSNAQRLALKAGKAVDILSITFAARTDYAEFLYRMGTKVEMSSFARVPPVEDENEDGVDHDRRKNKAENFTCRIPMSRDDIKSFN